MTLSSMVLGVGAFLCGIRAMGYWLILQLGGLAPGQRGGPTLVLWSSVALFLALSAAAAYLAERSRGVRAVGCKALFFMGAYGLPCIALFTLTSKGEILKMPGVMGLVVLLAGLVVVFRRATAKQVG